VLCGEPWYYTPAEAGRLTYYQVGRILYAERDDKGQVVIRPRADPLTDEERFKRVWLRRGVPRWRAEELWRKQLQQAAKAEAGKGSRGRKAGRT
jgi:hypothetical protein